jgi:hypothetical protein
MRKPNRAAKGRPLVGRRSNRVIERPRDEAIESVCKLAVGVGDGRDGLRRVDHDLVTEDEPERAGLVHQPLQRPLRQRFRLLLTLAHGANRLFLEFGSGHRGRVTSRERPRTLGSKGTFLKLPETDVNLIFLDRGCLDKDTNSNEAIAVSRITQDDQIGLLEPG